ncbi:expansin family protein [Moniliophthora roreri]|uniref:RlpA-like protein double-psi beta-barrel domain-containing protein n=1 Tax=Moniliophthora roreri TaxID=221103 RepID=A0A0W0F475_MONRR|nr:expansin family protein [Moniliophthora roreri]
MFTKFFVAVSALTVLSAQAAPSLVARQNVGDVTFYTPGLGSCGLSNGPGELVAAVSAAIFDTFPGAGPNPNLNPICGKRARVTIAGKSVDVTVVDRCPGCVGGSIDLSPAAFNILADPSFGRIPGASWTFI